MIVGLIALLAFATLAGIAYACWAEARRFANCPKHCWHEEVRLYGHADRCCHCRKWRGGKWVMVEGHGFGIQRWEREA